MTDGNTPVGTPPLEPGVADVWFGYGRVCIPGGSSWMLPAEHSHAESYRFSADRERYVLARVMQ